MAKIYRCEPVASENGLDVYMVESQSGQWVEIEDIRPYIEDVLDRTHNDPVYKAAANILRQLFVKVEEVRK
jgi:hypothetical protein